MTLYRPVGLFELRLIRELNFEAFPPRLYWQPIFYPVLTYSYAERIARDWNMNDRASGYAGYVTRFEVDDAYVKGFEVHVVGGEDCQELWVPAGDLQTFNDKIRGQIEVVAEFKGEFFREDAEMPVELGTNPTGNGTEF